MGQQSSNDTIENKGQKDRKRRPLERFKACDLRKSEEGKEIEKGRESHITKETKHFHFFGKKGKENGVKSIKDGRKERKEVTDERESRGSIREGFEIFHRNEDGSKDTKGEPTDFGDGEGFELEDVGEDKTPDGCGGSDGGC